MEKIFILTSRELENLGRDDHQLVNAFHAKGIETEVVIWDEEKIPNDSFVLIRTIWDYVPKKDIFMKLLEDFKARNIRCFNSTDIVKWNMNKSYLLELAQKNINVVPTKIASKFSKEDIQNEVFPIVVKPLYGASGVDTFLLKESTYSQDISNLYGREVMIQPYMESIKTEGEYSFLFFNGVFSHAVLKQSTNDDFRIQEGYGGIVNPYEPNEQELEQIINIVKHTNLNLAYCRVDVVRDDNIFKLMELELIEPELFFRFSNQGEEKLVEAVISLSNK